MKFISNISDLLKLYDQISKKYNTTAWPNSNFLKKLYCMGASPRKCGPYTYSLIHQRPGSCVLRNKQK